jgi:hypothetical protein
MEYFLWFKPHRIWNAIALTLAILLVYRLTVYRVTLSPVAGRSRQIAPLVLQPQ